MTRQCAWCGAGLAMDSAHPEPGISHGMCRCCAEIMFPRSETRADPEPHRGPTEIGSLLTDTPARSLAVSHGSPRS